RRHTRFSRDWSSDVCSSDLHVLNAHGIWNARILNQKPPFGVWQIFPVAEWQTIDISNFENSLSVIDDDDLHRELSYVNSRGDARSEERRVGKECRIGEVR